MGHLHPPNQNYYVLDIMEFLPPTLKKINFSRGLGKEYQTAPPNLISGFATETNFKAPT